MLLPIGDHKGYGLALFIDTLSGVLTGSGFGPGILSTYRELKKPNRCGYLLVALDTARFLPLEEFNIGLKISPAISRSHRAVTILKGYICPAK